MELWEHTAVPVVFAIKIISRMSQPQKLNARKFFGMNNNYSHSEMNQKNF